MVADRIGQPIQIDDYIAYFVADRYEALRIAKVTQISQTKRYNRSVPLITCKAVTRWYSRTDWQNEREDKLLTKLVTFRYPMRCLVVQEKAVPKHIKNIIDNASY